MPLSGSITACLFLLFSPRIKGPYFKKIFFLFFLSVLLLAGAKHWLGPQAAVGKAPSQEQKAGLGETGGGEAAGAGGRISGPAALWVEKSQVCLPGPRELAPLPGLSSGDAELLPSHPLSAQEPQAPLLPALRWDLVAPGPGRAALA